MVVAAREPWVKVVVVVMVPDMRLRLGRGFTRLRVGNSGTSNIGVAALYIQETVSSLYYFLVFLFRCNEFESCYLDVSFLWSVPVASKNKNKNKNKKSHSSPGNRRDQVVSCRAQTGEHSSTVAKRVRVDEKEQRASDTRSPR